jgi:N-acylglucosamine-6-phosphate 2-epimerase
MALTDGGHTNIIEQIHNGLVVSCQAWPESPLCGPAYMAAMARAAAKGGAAGLRLNGVEDIRLTRQQLSLPIIGIQKYYPEEAEIWITPCYVNAVELAGAGADIIAIDGMHRKRLDGLVLGEMVERVHQDLHRCVMVDISTYDEAVSAQDLGADLVATTFSMFGQDRETPDYDLLFRLTQELTTPVVAEGLYWTPEQVCKAFELGAHAVVVGTAITRPDEITERFVKAIQNRRTAELREQPR